MDYYNVGHSFQEQKVPLDYSFHGPVLMRRDHDCSDVTFVSLSHRRPRHTLHETHPVCPAVIKLLPSDGFVPAAVAAAQRNSGAGGAGRLTIPTINSEATPTTDHSFLPNRVRHIITNSLPPQSTSRANAQSLPLRRLSDYHLDKQVGKMFTGVGQCWFFHTNLTLRLHVNM